MKKTLSVLLVSLAATSVVPSNAGATTLTTAQIRGQYLKDVLPVNEALAPLSGGALSIDQIDTDRAGIKATLVKFDNQLQGFITTFDNRVADYKHESSATLQTAITEGDALSSEQTADGILVTDIYAEPKMPAMCGLSCMTAVLIWTTRVIDDALVLPHYQAIVVADFGPVPSAPGAFHVVAQNTAVGSGADARIDIIDNGNGYTGQEELIVTSTPPQMGTLSWGIVCSEASGATAHNGGQVNTAFPVTKLLTLPVQNAAGGCAVLADASLNGGGSVTIRLAVTGHVVSNT